MERWHLSLLLAAGAAVGALVAPQLTHREAPPDESAPDAIPEVSIVDVPLGTSWHPAGDLSLDVRLDQSSVLQGSDGLRYVVVSVTAPDGAQGRVPVDVALVVDASGSMGQEGKLTQARMAAEALVDGLRLGDRFSLVSFDDQARVLAPGASFDGDTERLHALIGGLRDDGGTNLWDGVTLGRAQLAAGHPASKVLLVSDGNANVGETEPEAFARLARSYAEQGVSVSAIGLGRDFNETLLEGMADAAGGTYRFVGEPEELPSVIADELQRTTETFARRLTVRIEPARGVTFGDVYGWDERRDGESVEVEVGDIAAGQTRKIVLAVDVPTTHFGPRAVATTRLTYTSVDGDPGNAQARTRLVVTEHEEAAAASVDEQATIAATRARAGELARASAAAWRVGDAPRARSMMEGASMIIAEARETTNAPELRADAARMVELQALGYAEGGSYAAKAASEAGRDLAR